MNKLIFVLLLIAPSTWAEGPWAPKPFGVLLLSHGGSSEWNQTVQNVRDSLAREFPIEIAFGMADSREIQRAADKLAGQKVRKIIAIPLFISSHSEVIEQTKYVLGIRKDASKDFMNAPHAHLMTMDVRRLHTKLPVVLSSALDDSPVVAEILLKRAREMSRDPSQEAVVLVGHGPLKNADNDLWLQTMQRLADSVRKEGGFRTVRVATLRDDAQESVRQKADRELRDMVSELSRQGRVLVVPHLIAAGGIERHIQTVLDGMFYAWKGHTLLPDPGIAVWIERSARQAQNEPDMRRYKGGP